MELTQTVDLKK